MAKKIITETHAYNASSTLERTIKSVLAQTYENWEWHLFENGSTDNGATFDIITKYAKIDSRIKPYQNIPNIPRNTYLFLGSRIVLSEHKNDYFSYICADDTWEPDFLSDILNFLQENNLDIATCTSRHINAETGECLNKFFLQENIFATSPNEYSEKFCTLYSFYRELWGHLIPFSTLQKLSYFNYLTAFNENRYSFLKFNLQLLSIANKVGILAKPLHNYYLSSKGEVREPLLRDHRLDHFKNICPILRTFLISKCGFISRANEKFILERYIKTIYDYLPVIFESEDDVKKLLFIANIIRFSDTERAFESPLVSPELKANFADKVSYWLRNAVQNQKLQGKVVVGDKAGHFKYFAAESGTNNLSGAVYDFYNIRGNFISINKKFKKYGAVNSTLSIILELQEFLIKYSSEA